MENLAQIIIFIWVRFNILPINTSIEVHTRSTIKVIWFPYPWKLKCIDTETSTGYQ